MFLCFPRWFVASILEAKREGVRKCGGRVDDSNLPLDYRLVIVNLIGRVDPTTHTFFTVRQRSPHKEATSHPHPPPATQPPYDHCLPHDMVVYQLIIIHHDEATTQGPQTSDGFAAVATGATKEIYRGNDAVIGALTEQQ